MILLWSTIYLLVFLYYRLEGAGDLNRTVGWGWDHSPALLFGWAWIPVILVIYFFIERSGFTLHTWLTKIHAFLMGLLVFSYLPFVLEGQPYIYQMTMLLIYLIFVINVVMSLIVGRSTK